MLQAIFPVGMAAQTYLRMNSDGILCLQHRVRTSTKDAGDGGVATANCFIDVIISPLAEEAADGEEAQWNGG